MRVKNASAKLLLLSAFCWLTGTAQAQNINNPNKYGPLGTQVNTMSGNVFIPRTDFYVPARALDFNISFFYNSFLFMEEYGYGKGWTFQYNIKYRIDTSNARLILWGDGREDQYDSLPGGAYKSPRGFFNTLAQYQPGKYRLTELNGVKYYFDNPVHKRITKLEDPNGNLINFSYTDSLLTSISNASGQSITFTYNGGRLASVVDGIATPTRTFTYSYDAAGNLKEVKDPLNGSYKYTYLINGPMKSLADKNNNKVDIIYFPDLSAREVIGCNKRISFSYDTATMTTIVTDYLETGNQVTKYTYKQLDNISWITSMTGNCCGFNTSFDYDDYGNMLSRKDANGQVYKYTYDEFGNRLTATDPLGNVNTYTYTSDFKKLSTYTDPKGNKYSLNYDAKGNLVKVTAPGNAVYLAAYNANGDITSSTDPNGNNYTYNYDSYGNPINVTGPAGYNATLVYDARGNLLSYTDGRGSHNEAEYDILNRLKKITDPINNSMEFSYDAQGNMTSYKNFNNERSVFDYDASNRLVNATGPTGNSTNFRYDAMDNLLLVKNPLGYETKYTYDSRNRLKSTSDPANNSATYNYDNNGNVTSVRLPNGHTVNYTYDARNRLTSIKDSEGEIIKLTHDKNGRVLSYTNGTGAKFTAAYDSSNRVVSVTDALGNSRFYTYDKNGNRSSVTDREGRTSYFTYDGRNRIKTYTDNSGGIISVGYDVQGNVTSLTDQNNNVTSYVYDSLNRRKRMTYPDGKYSEYFYDKKGNLVSVRRTDATYITYTYDTLNRLVNKQLPGGENYSFTYDKMSRVLSATNNNGTVSFTYDGLGRITAESYDGRTTKYNYDIVGRSQTIIYPDSAVVIKHFDERGRLLRIEKDSVLVAEYSYNNANQLTNRRYGNNINNTLQYDFANRLSNITTGEGSVQNSSFIYDKENNKTAINRQNASLSETFAYDNKYRLVNYKKGSSTENIYNYDAAGNRTGATMNGSPVTYTTNNLNQLTSQNGTTFTFDNRGNLTFDGVFYKTYDAENRLIQDSASPARVVKYGYDAINRRITKTVNGQLYKYSYSGVAQIEERDAAGDLLNRTVFTNFLSPVLNEKNGESFYYHANELGSVEAITNSNGRVIEKYNYDAYGKLSRFDSLNNPLAGSMAGNRFGFTGQEYDSLSGSYRFFYRSYSPQTGVFNQRDLIEYGDGMNMYRYVGNNPANGVDVWGLQETPSCPVDEYKKQLDKDEEKLTLDVTNNALTVTDLMNKGGLISDGLNNTLGKYAVVPAVMDFKGKVNNATAVTSNSNSTYQEMADANWSAVGSGGGVVGAIGGTAAILTGAAVAPAVAAGATTAAVYGVTDAVVEGVTSKPIGVHVADHTVHLQETHDFETWANENGLAADIYDFTSMTKPGVIVPGEQYAFIKNLWQHDKMMTYLMWKKSQNLYYYIPNPCGGGGTRIRVKWVWDPTKQMWILIPFDPNLIIGPDGKDEKKWVSVKDRMPYTVLFENDSTATARARYVKITTPIEPKQDAATLELGNFGFNNQSFEVPKGLATYYERLDARDSTGVYVDVVAGYDVMKHEIFWEFRAIDPATLMPPDDPLAGFLMLRDTANPAYGNGFVNFTMKPLTSAQTLDTIGARAFITFDENEVIPTNIHTNTIDAVAPTSQMLSVNTDANRRTTLTWSGVDDANGIGVDYYTIYVSNDRINYSILIPQIRRTDTTLVLPPDSVYCFFVLATDRVGNTETLRPNVSTCYSIGTTLPVTWLYFNGTTQGKNNILTWATGSETNTKEFSLERSLNGNTFQQITSLPAAGNSATTREYKYTDTNIDRLNSERMYYRVKQVDLDGRFTYSRVVLLTYRENNSQPSVIYPNPTKGIVNILVGDRSMVGTEATLIDVNGRILQRVKITASNQSFDMSALVNGIYFIKLVNKETLRVIKQ